MGRSDRILIAGASGYVGGRLLKALEDSGHHIRCLARRPEFLRPKVSPATEVVAGDLLDASTPQSVFENIDVAYYLVHSMGGTGRFELDDRRAAINFSACARSTGVRRIVYLGGLSHGERLSPHLASRQEVGAILRGSGVPTVEFRASIIIGSGSLSFELIRALVNKLPVMTTPRWTRSKAQPIAIGDVVAYLTEAAAIDLEKSIIVEIGGAEQVSYLDLMKEYARQRGLRRLIIPVPVLSPGLSSLWLGLVTPLYARIGRKLIDSVRYDTVVKDNSALTLFGIRPCGIREAIAGALADEDRGFAQTRWSDAVSSTGTPRSWGGARFGSRLVDTRAVTTRVSPDKAFGPIRRIGGRTGWYSGNGLWRLRGFLDLLVGGAGMRRGRRDAEHLAPGDVVDFWRVEAVTPDRLLRLAAEMKLPGRAWLQFDIEPAENGSTIRQTAIFDPAGILGLVYWYGLYPVHSWVFRRMLKGIVARAESS